MTLYISPFQGYVVEISTLNSHYEHENRKQCIAAAIWKLIEQIWTGLWPILSMRSTDLSEPYVILLTMYAILSERYAIIFCLYAILSELCAIIFKRYAILSEQYAILFCLYAILLEPWAIIFERYAILSKPCAIIFSLYAILSRPSKEINIVIIFDINWSKSLSLGEGFRERLFLISITPKTIKLWNHPLRHPLWW